MINRTISLTAAIAVLVYCAFLPQAVLAQVDPSAAKFALEKAGLSAARLKRLDAYLNGIVQTGALQGAVVAVSRHGRVALTRAYGHLDSTGQRPMPVDAVFDLSLLTEPVTAAAALVLQEQGQWLLSDSVGRYVPSFAQLPVSIWDSLRHTAGLSATLPPERFESGAVARPSERLTHSVQAAMSFTGQSFLTRLASQPLRNQPGLIAERSFAYDLLGLAIERASNQTLGTFFLSHLFIPMDMWDTGFNPAAGLENRLVSHQGKRAPSLSEAPIRDLREPVSFECGGACLTSTAADYLQFASMLLNGGQVNGQRVLSRPSIELMTRNQLGSKTENRLPAFVRLNHGFASEFGFGLGLTVTPAGARSALPGSPGDFGLSSPGGSFFWVSRTEQMAIVMLAVLRNDQQPMRLQRQVTALVTQSIND